MRATLVTLMVLAGASTLPAAADEISRCVLEVNGQSYIDGPCEFSPFGDGDFEILGKKHFAYVYPSTEPVVGYWNEDPQSTHAQDPLGELTKDGACWVNANARVCAYE